MEKRTIGALQRLINGIWKISWRQCHDDDDDDDDDDDRPIDRSIDRHRWHCTKSDSLRTRPPRCWCTRRGKSRWLLNSQLTERASGYRMPRTFSVSRTSLKRYWKLSILYTVDGLIRGWIYHENRRVPSFTMQVTCGSFVTNSKENKLESSMFNLNKCKKFILVLELYPLWKSNCLNDSSGSSHFPRTGMRDVRSRLQRS